MTSSEDRRAFGRRLQALRLGREMTQSLTAARSLIPLRTYQGYEQGRSFPTASRLAILCRVLAAAPEDLIPYDWTQEIPQDVSGDLYATPANRTGSGA